ncbi:MAG: type II toxin-antitoxin system RelE/ParE family toxin [Oscillospiraceae bacterium]|jgi:mRNA interferase RelE/StbE|nr:type II toxin-antitoxin system RelE/ParE family toxin [Oscillospiraceae bacterium]
MNIEYRKLAEKQLQQMSEPTKNRIKTAIDGLPNGDIRKIEGTAGDYGLRVGKYRVIYTYNDADTIVIVKIQSRGQVYKGGH